MNCCLFLFELGIFGYFLSFINGCFVGVGVLLIGWKLWLFCVVLLFLKNGWVWLVMLLYNWLRGIEVVWFLNFFICCDVVVIMLFNCVNIVEKLEMFGIFVFEIVVVSVFWMVWNCFCVVVLLVIDLWRFWNVELSCKMMVDFLC